MNQQKLNNVLYIILIALVCVVIYKSYNKQENFADISGLTTQSNEAIQSISSVYNTEKMILSNPVVKNAVEIIKKLKLLDNFNDSMSSFELEFATRFAKKYKSFLHSKRICYHLGFDNSSYDLNNSER